MSFLFFLIQAYPDPVISVTRTAHLRCGLGAPRCIRKKGIVMQRHPYSVDAPYLLRSATSEARLRVKVRLHGSLIRRFGNTNGGEIVVVVRIKRGARGELTSFCFCFPGIWDRILFRPRGMRIDFDDKKSIWTFNIRTFWSTRSNIRDRPFPTFVSASYLQNARVANAVFYKSISFPDNVDI